LLSNEELGEEFAAVIRNNRADDLLQYPAVVSTTLHTGSNNYTALQEMMRRNLEALVVIDDGRRPAGVVERDQVLTTLVLSLTESVRS